MNVMDYIAKRAWRQDDGQVWRLPGKASPTFSPLPNLPLVHLVGQIDYPDFAEAISLLRASARLTGAPDDSPELIVIAQSRPGAVSSRDVERLRRRAPLAGVAALLGTWCEGETRTGRPFPGVTRLYWYEFPAWWRRQLRLRAAGRCPDWARGGDFGLRHPGTKPTPASRGVIELCATHRETADALTDVLQPAGYASVWHCPGQCGPFVRGAVAGIWDGGQLDEREAGELATFCRRLGRSHAPVIALLDFPRRDRVDLALRIGASTVLGKPWLNEDFLATIDEVLHDGKPLDKRINNRAA